MISRKRLTYFLGWILVLSVLLLLWWPILGRQLFANDLWKALYSGRYLAVFQQFPSHSTFTYNPTVDVWSRNATNWLGNLTLLGLYRVGGAVGLQVFRGLLLGFAGMLLLAILKWRMNPFVLVILAVFGYGIEQKLLLRTAIFAVPMLSIIIWAWARFILNQDGRYLWIIPPVLILWSNFHGSFLVGTGLLVVLIAGELLGSQILHSSAYNLTSSLILVAAVTFALLPIVKPFPTMPIIGDLILSNRSEPAVSDPNRTDSNDAQRSANTTNLPQQHHLGRPDLLPEITDVVSRTNKEPPQRIPWNTIHTLKKSLHNLFFPDQRFRSSEFHSPFEVTSHLMVRMNFLLVPLILMSLLFFRSRPSTWFATGAVVLLGMSSLRATPYIALALIPLASLEYRRSNWSLNTGPRAKQLIDLISIVAIGLLGGNVFSLSLTDDIHRLTGGIGHSLGTGTHQKFSTTMARYTLNRYPDRRLFNSYNSGAFLIWHWWPNKKVFVDSKWSAYHPDFRRMYATTPLPDILNERGIHHALSEKNNYWTLFFVRSDEWKVLKTDRQMLLYQRKNYDNE